jgi:hypothetical protein
MSDGLVVIEGEGPLAHFRMCQVIAALKIEVRGGMVHSGGSILKVAQQRYGCTARTKKGALDQMLALYEKTYGYEYGKPLQEPNDAR